jgi:hypothetical protein
MHIDFVDIAERVYKIYIRELSPQQCCAIEKASAVYVLSVEKLVYYRYKKKYRHWYIAHYEKGRRWQCSVKEQDIPKLQKPKKKIDTADTRLNKLIYNAKYHKDYRFISDLVNKIEGSKLVFFFRCFVS